MAEVEGTASSGGEGCAGVISTNGKTRAEKERRQMNYSVFLPADADNRRDYRDRQLHANEQGADVYVEFHFNASAYDKPGTQDNPSSVLVCDNASQTSRDMAKDFSDAMSSAYGYPNRGVVELKRHADGSADRAYYNLFYTKMKAFLLEPLYVSDVEQSAVALSEEGQKSIAAILVDVIKKYFPDGAKCAFSLGHKFKASSIHDRGAPVVIGYDDDESPAPIHHPTLAEADLAEKVLFFAKAMLEGKEEPEEPEDEIFLVGEWSISGSESGLHLRRTNG